MDILGVTGGIGSGKSTVTDLLAARGWTIVDADVIAREVVQPGEGAWRAIRDAFGDAVLTTTGAIDREFLAAIVFTDATARRRLEAITHPVVGRRMVERVAAAREAGASSVAVAIPLLRPLHRELLGLTYVIAVEVDPEVAVSRLVAGRGMRPEDARARIAAQPRNEERAALVDAIVRNDGSVDDLRAGLDAVLSRAGLS